MIPNPGSIEARDQGCCCPVLDNGRGKGWMGGVKDPETGETIFVITMSCPLHGTESDYGKRDAT